MQIKNPTKTKIEGIKIGASTYSIEAEGVLNNVPEKDARYWQENLHKFLILKKDSLETGVKQEVVEIPTPKVEEVVSAVSVQDEAVLEEALNTEVEVTTAEEIKEESPVVAEKPSKTNKIK
jgi:hypothetical protein